MESTKELESKRMVTELARENVTETVLKRFKDNYLPIKINGVDDKENYALAKRAYSECKTTRIATEKICKKSREEAIAIQKAWVAKEKEIVNQITLVETHLKGEIDRVDAEAEKIKIRNLRLSQLPNRKVILTQNEVPIPSDDEVLLALDEAGFITYLNQERTKILDARAAALAAKSLENLDVSTPEHNPADFKAYENMPSTSDPRYIGTFTGTTVSPKPVFNPQIPEKQIIVDFAQSLYNWNFPEVKTPAAKEIIDYAKQQFEALAMNIGLKAQKLNS